MRKHVTALAIAVVLATAGTMTAPATATAGEQALPHGRLFKAKGYTFEKLGKKICALVKVNDKGKRKYTIPKSVKYKGKRLRVNMVKGEPFAKCRKARSIVIKANLEYIEDPIFWGVSKGKAKITTTNRVTRKYLGL